MFTPPLGFHFKVEVMDLQPMADDVRFIEVGGLALEVATEEVPEGGENRFVQRYPGRPKYSDLVLKRGLLKGSKVFEWARQCIEELDVVPHDVNVTLLNEQHEPLMTWHVIGAFPIKWSVSDFNASANAFVVETLTLAYRNFRVDANG
ncbi:MAG: phage tail protein [Leptothrix sp. (in: b-proteobacteria)]